MLSWLEQHMLPCAYKNLFGMDCPACGAQRSFIQLLKGNIAESLIIYPPLIPVITVIILALLYFSNNRLVTGRFLRAYSVAVLILVAINYLVKMF